MKTEIKIIKYLIENKDEVTIRELSRKIGSDYRITHTAIKRLIEKKIIETKIIGKAIVLLPIMNFSSEVFEAEYQRKTELVQNKNFQIIIDDVKKDLKTPFFISLVFGSHAKKSATKNSDIDLMFIVNKKKYEQKIVSTLNLLPLKSHLLIFTEKEFQKMKDSKQKNVVKEAIKNNILLYGVEQYYELLRC